MMDPAFVKGSFTDLVGYELVDWRDGFAAAELELTPGHMNRSGVLHGGVLSTIIDVTLGYTGTWAPQGAPIRRALTLSLSVQFLATGRPGERIRVESERTGGGKTIFFGRALVLGPDGHPLAQGEGSFKLLRVKD